MKTIMALVFCLSLVAVGCGPTTPMVKPTTPGGSEPDKADKKTDTNSDTGSGSAY